MKPLRKHKYDIMYIGNCESRNPVLRWCINVKGHQILSWNTMLRFFKHIDLQDLKPKGQQTYAEFETYCVVRWRTKSLVTSVLLSLLLLNFIILLLFIIYFTYSERLKFAMVNFWTFTSRRFKQNVGKNCFHRYY